MEELIEKRIKKYKTISIVGIIAFLGIILFQIWYVTNGDYSCSSPGYITISVQEIDAFNEDFDYYEGEQFGSNVKVLLSKLMANAATYKEVEGRIPEIKYEDKESSDSVYFEYEEGGRAKLSYELKKYNDWIKIKKEGIDVKSIYNIECGYDEFTKLINLIKITKVED